MFRLKKLLGLCEHKWETIDEYTYYLYDETGIYILRRSRIYVLKCEKCGNIKKKKI